MEINEQLRIGHKKNNNSNQDKIMFGVPVGRNNSKKFIMRNKKRLIQLDKRLKKRIVIQNKGKQLNRLSNSIINNVISSNNSVQKIVKLSSNDSGNALKKRDRLKNVFQVTKVENIATVIPNNESNNPEPDNLINSNNLSLIHI